MGAKIRFRSLMTAIFASGLLMAGAVAATPIDEISCAKEPESGTNFMTMDVTQASRCLASGHDNPSFTQNSKNDIFLNYDSGTGDTFYQIGYRYIDKIESENVVGGYKLQFGQGNWNDDADSSGSWGFSSELWNVYDSIALGFKFGSGKVADNWFVYKIKPEVRNGEWSYFGKGDGLSNVAAYGIKATSVPEPGTLALLSLGIVGLLLARRRNSTKRADRVR